MDRPKRATAVPWLIAFLVVMVVGATLLLSSRLVKPETGFYLSDRLADVRVVETAEGPRVELETDEGRQVVTPAEFVARLAARQGDAPDRGGLLRAMDITGWYGLIWVGFGLLAQVMFTARMIVQWLVSEKAGRSTVPVAFWWMSLIGASMLVTYFLWRRDVVGILGQSTGWFIYGRNLWLIYRSGPR